MRFLTLRGSAPSDASLSALKLVVEGTRCICYANATQHRDAVAPRPDVRRPLSSIEHRGGAQGGLDELLLDRRLFPGQSLHGDVVGDQRQRLMVSFDSVHPSRVWLCPGERLVGMSVFRT